MFIAIRCVSISISYDVMQQTIKGIYGKVLNIIPRISRDGLLSGIKIVTMA